MRLAHINPAHAERPGFAQHVDREYFVPVPCNGERGQARGGKTARHVANCALVLIQFE